MHDQNAGVAAAGPVKKWLFKTALNAKKAELEQGIVRNNSIWDLLVFRKVCVCVCVCVCVRIHGVVCCASPCKQQLICAVLNSN